MGTTDKDDDAPLLESPHSLGQLPRRRPGDWRREDRERFRSSQTIGRLTALLVIPATIVGAALAASRAISVPLAGAIIIAIWIAGAAALWWSGKGSRRA